MEKKINLWDNSHSAEALAYVKEVEKQQTNLERVEIMKGYVLTNDPQKWEGYNEAISNYKLDGAYEDKNYTSDSYEFFRSDDY